MFSFRFGERNLRVTFRHDRVPVDFYCRGNRCTEERERTTAFLKEGDSVILTASVVRFVKDQPNRKVANLFALQKLTENTPRQFSKTVWQNFIYNGGLNTTTLFSFINSGGVPIF